MRALEGRAVSTHKAFRLSKTNGMELLGWGTKDNNILPNGKSMLIKSVQTCYSEGVPPLDSCFHWPLQMWRQQRPDCCSCWWRLRLLRPGQEWRWRTSSFWPPADPQSHLLPPGCQGREEGACRCSVFAVQPLSALGWAVKKKARLAPSHKIIKNKQLPILQWYKRVSQNYRYAWESFSAKS